MLMIAVKNYNDQALTGGLSDGSLKKVSRYLKDAAQAHEINSKNAFFKSLKKAYANVPHSQLGTRMAADIVESYLQVEAYDQVIETAEQMERQGYYTASDSAAENYDLFRIFANKSEAHEALCEPGKARIALEKALDYQLESGEEVDVEMLMLLSK